MSRILLYRRRMILPLLLLGLLSCGDDNVVAPPQQGSPELTIKEINFDFGSVPQASVISHRFWLYSTGTDTLHITQIVPG